MTKLQKQGAIHENEARAANEVVSVEAEQAHLAGYATLTVVCECGDALCQEALTMSVDQ